LPPSSKTSEYDDESLLDITNPDADTSFGTNAVGTTVQACSPPPPIGTERDVVCGAICSCNAMGQKQWCVSRQLWAVDDAADNHSTIKAEVPYDMSTDPPAPYMSKRLKDKRPTRRRPAGSRIPDVVIVNDGSKPPVQSNIREIYEIKFPPDDWSDGQEADYAEIAGDNAPVTVLSPSTCGCGDEQKKGAPVRVPMTVPFPETEPIEVPGLELPEIPLAIPEFVL